MAELIARKKISRRRDELNPRERHTIISFDDARGIATIHSHNVEWQRHLETVLGLEPIEKAEDGGRTYEVAKGRINPPQAPGKLSPKARENLAAYLRSNKAKSQRNTEKSPEERSNVGKRLCIRD